MAKTQARTSIRLDNLKLKIPYLWLLILPFVLMHLGEWANILAISVNHGVMPTVVPTAQWQIANAQGAGLYPGAMLDEVHKIMVPGDHLKFLCDVIIQKHASDVTSIGDQLMWLGEWLQIPMFASWLTAISLKATL